jgi:hypothetical protein
MYLLEVVAFDPSINKEAPHLYIKSEELCKNLRRHEATQSNSNANTGMERADPGTKYGEQMMVKYILNRISIVKPSLEQHPCVSSVAPNATESFREVMTQLPPELSPSGKKTFFGSKSSPAGHATATVTNLQLTENEVLRATAEAGFQAPTQEPADEPDEEGHFAIELLRMGEDDDRDVPFLCESIPAGLCKLPDLRHLK